MLTQSPSDGKATRKTEREEGWQRAHPAGGERVAGSSRGAATLKLRGRAFQGERLVRKEAESGAFFFYLVPRN